MRKIIRIVFVLGVVSSFVCLSLAAEYKYVGSSKSNKYHYPSCEWAAKISPQNLVTFKTAKEALNAGYVACKVCSVDRRPRIEGFRCECKSRMQDQALDVMGS
jgi:methylphosphotriester-DNA--protein-cysteine methyltransferase